MEIEAGLEREIAIECLRTVRAVSDLVVYLDASGREDHLLACDLC
jgi:hypothetical protein